MNQTNTLPITHRHVINGQEQLQAELSAAKLALASTKAREDVSLHPAYIAITSIVGLLTQIDAAKKALAELESDAREAIPLNLKTYYDVAGKAAEDRITLANGQELVIDEEWYEHRNPLGAVRLARGPQSLEAIATAAMLATTTQPD